MAVFKLAAPSVGMLKSSVSETFAIGPYCLGMPIKSYSNIKGTGFWGRLQRRWIEGGKVAKGETVYRVGERVQVGDISWKIVLGERNGFVTRIVGSTAWQAKGGGKEKWEVAMALVYGNCKELYGEQMIETGEASVRWMTTFGIVEMTANEVGVAGMPSVYGLTWEGELTKSTGAGASFAN